MNSSTASISGSMCAVRVVAGNVVVELLPEPLDDVRLRRVGRQEVKHDAPAEPGQVPQRPPRLVDDEIIENEVDVPGTPVRAAQRIDQGEEELRVLPLGDGVDNLAAPGVQRAGHIALHVLAGRDDVVLFAGERGTRTGAPR